MYQVTLYLTDTPKPMMFREQSSLEDTERLVNLNARLNIKYYSAIIKRIHQNSYMYFDQSGAEIDVSDWIDLMKEHKVNLLKQVL